MVILANENSYHAASHLKSESRILHGSYSMNKC